MKKVFKLFDLTFDTFYKPTGMYGGLIWTRSWALPKGDYVQRMYIGNGGVEESTHIRHDLHTNPYSGFHMVEWLEKL